MSIATLRNQAIQLKERLTEALEAPGGGFMVIIATDDTIKQACQQYAKLKENPDDFSRAFIMDLTDAEEFSQLIAVINKQIITSEVGCD